MATDERSREARVIAETIVAERHAKGLTQKELAEAVGISQQALLRYEKGRRDIPLVDFMRIAAVLGLPIPVIARRLQDRLETDPE